MLLTLTGCTQTISDPPAAQPTETSAPLTAESPAVKEADGSEKAYLADVRDSLPSDTVIPNASDEQLLAAGERACEELAAGADTLTVSLIDGEPQNGLGYYESSSAIITAASRNLCD